MADPGCMVNALASRNNFATSFVDLRHVESADYELWQLILSAQSFLKPYIYERYVQYISLVSATSINCIV